MAHLRILDHLFHVVDRRGGNAGLLERIEQVLIEIEIAISSQEERVKARHSLATGVAIKRSAVGGIPS